MNANFSSSIADLWLIAGWTMVHFLWLGTLVAAAAFVCRMLLHRAAPTIRYATALTMFFLLGAIPFATAAWLYQNSPPSKGGAGGGILSDVATLPSVASSVSRDAGTDRQVGGRSALTAQSPSNFASAEPIIELNTPGAALTTSNLAIQTPTQNVNIRALPAENRTTAQNRTANNPPAQLKNVLLWLSLSVAYLPWLWLIGTPLTFILLLTGILGSRRLRTSSRPVAGGPIADLLARLRTSLHITRRVTISICDRIAAPVLIGIIRPVILLPPVALTGWSPDELEMVLLHELAHVRRWDNLTNLLQRTIESLLFFHPAVWLLSAWVRHEREACCDAAVIARTNRPHAYAELLVNFAARVSHLSEPGRPRPRVQALSPQLHSAMAAGPLRYRIRRILQLENDPMLISAKSFAIVAVSFALVATLALLYLPTIGHAEPSATETTENTESNQSKADSIDRSELPRASEFPHMVQFEVGAHRFVGGDEIEIQEVRGTAKTFEPNNKYWIKGTYKLASRDRAHLSAFVTGNDPAYGTSPIENFQQKNIDRGQGEFILVLPMKHDGSPHVSFYPAGGGDGFGGIYFGTGDSVLKKWWDEREPQTKPQSDTTDPTPGQPPQNYLKFVLTQGKNGQAILSLNDRPISIDQIDSVLPKDRAALETAVTSLCADKSVSYSQVMRIVDKLESLGVKKLALDTRNVVDSPLATDSTNREPVAFHGVQVIERVPVTMSADDLVQKIESLVSKNNRAKRIAISIPSAAPREYEAEVREKIRERLADKQLSMTRYGGDQIQIVIASAIRNLESTAPTPSDPKPSSKFPSLEDQKLADVAYKRLGLELEPAGPEDLERAKALGYDGAVKVAGVVGNTEQIQSLDLLVGLHVWPTTSLKDVNEILNRDDLAELNPLKFYVIRRQTRFPGGPGPDELKTGRINVQSGPPTHPDRRQSTDPIKPRPVVADAPSIGAESNHPWAAQPDATPWPEPQERSLVATAPTPTPDPYNPTLQPPGTPYQRLLGAPPASTPTPNRNVPATAPVTSQPAVTPATGTYSTTAVAPQPVLAPNANLYPPTTYIEPQPNPFPSTSAHAIGNIPLLVVFFYSSTGPESLQLSDEQFQELKNKLRGKAQLSRVDVIKESAADLVSEYKVDKVPAYVFLHFGKVIDRLVGRQSADQVLAAAAKHESLSKEKPRDTNTIPAKSTLRYNGQSFDEWRDRWQTELSSEKRAEAVRALAAFARAGYGKEATDAILDVAEQYDFKTIDSSAEGKLKETIWDELSPADRNAPLAKYWLPEIIARTEKDPAKWKPLAGFLIGRLQTDDESLINLLREVAGREKSDIRGLALATLIQSTNGNNDSDRKLVEDAVNSKDPAVVKRALQLLTFLPPSSGGTAPEARVRFLPQNFTNILLGPNEGTQRAARGILRYVDDNDAARITDEMLAVLKDDARSQNHLAAIRALAALGPRARKAKPALMELLKKGSDMNKVPAIVIAMIRLSDRNLDLDHLTGVPPDAILVVLKAVFKSDDIAVLQEKLRPITSEENNLINLLTNEWQTIFPSNDATRAGGGFF